MPLSVLDDVLPEDVPLLDDAALFEDPPSFGETVLPEDVPLLEDTALPVDGPPSFEETVLPEDAPMLGAAGLPEKVMLFEEGVLTDDIVMFEGGI